MTVEERIRQDVIESRVLEDINIVGGMSLDLHTSSASVIHDDGGGVAYHFSDDHLHGHRIISAHIFTQNTNSDISTSIELSSNHGSKFSGNPGMGTSFGDTCSDATGDITGFSQNKEIMTAQRKLANSVQIPDTQIQLRMVAVNTILMQNVSDPREGWFNVLVTNDEHLNNIEPKSWRAFATLCQLAVKAHIYNELELTIGEAAIMNGQLNDRLSNYISKLEDSEELYQEALVKWEKIAFMNDGVAHAQLIRAGLNPGGL